MLVAARLPSRSRPLRLTALPFAHPTMLAPMEGVTHPVFRAMTAERGGVGCLCTEFVRITKNELSPSALSREVVKHEGVPLSVQVMGNEIARMAEAAEIVSDAGADIVDVNVGCPMPRVVRKGVGAALLKDPELLYRLLCSMRARTPGWLSAKIRAGFDDAEDVLALGEVVEKAGVDFLVVHPRRRADFYRGVADWRIIGALAAHLAIPVVGNGDVWYAADALRMVRETGCAAVMIGRPALRNPWIFEQIADLRAGRDPRRPSGSDLVAHLVDVAARYRSCYRRPVGKLKELVRYLARAIDDERAFMTAALRLDDVDAILTLAERSIGHLDPGALDLDAYGTLALERSGSATHEASAA